MSQIAAGVGLPIAFVLLCTGCSTSWFVEDADAEVAELLTPSVAQVRKDRRESAIPTELRVEEEKGEEPTKEDPEKEDPAKVGEVKSAAQDPAAEEPAIQLIGLDEALETAVKFNRDYKDQEESLYLAGLGTTLTRFNFGPILSASLGSSWSRDEGLRTAHSNTGSFTASQILPTGADLALSSSFTERDVGKSFTLSATQPLLRGLGYDISHEALIQSERDIIYSIREFERFRERFSIGIARSFFDLVGEKKRLSNNEANYEQAAYDRQRAEVLRQMDRNTEQDVFRARRTEINAENALVGSRAAYKASLDNFKIQLGLETSAPLDVKDQEPPFEPVRIDVESAVRAAKHNRLDILSRRQQLDDIRRGVRIAKNNLLPNFDLDLSGTLDDSAGTDAKSSYSGSVGLSLEIPLQRKAERNAYRSAVIGLQRAERSFTLELDNLEIQIRDQLRRLETNEQQQTLQQEQIEQQERAVIINQLRYEQGVIENRDLLESRQSLVDAKNELIDLRTTHFISRLQLLSDIGLLFISDEGKWQ